MSFSKSSTGINLIPNNLLLAKCSDNGDYFNSWIDLNEIIVNVNGNFIWGSGGYVGEAKDVHLENNTILTAQLKNDDGKWQFARINLDDAIGNNHGALVFSSPN